MKRLWKKIQSWFADLGIREKLLLSFLLLISVPVVLIATCSYLISSKIVEEKAYEYSHDLLFQTTKTMEVRLAKTEDISFNIIFNNEMQQLLFEASSGVVDSFRENQIRVQVENILASHVLYHDEINAIYIMSLSGSKYELNKTKQAYAIDEENLSRIEEGKGSTIWIGGLADQRIVALTRQINSIRTQKPIGYMVLYVDETYLYDVLMETYSVPEGNIHIIDQDGYIMSDANKEVIGTSYLDDYTLHFDRGYQFEKLMIAGHPQYVAVSESMSNGWRITTEVPVSIYLREIKGLRNTILLSVLLLLVLAILYAGGLATGISKPIRRLSSIMVEFGKGELTLRCPEGAKDETGMLSETFNQMADNITTLVQKVYEEQLMKRDAELKSLQMQINPHFLYNTLETINWMARTHGNEEIGIMVKSLGDLMRYTINGGAYVQLYEEIGSLKNYLQIQKYRYEGKLEAQLEIMPETEHLYVPKLIIQPLVENAIYHGIEPLFDMGTIQIKSLRQNDDLVIIIQDNGVGMTEETIRAVLNIGEKSKKTISHSIGLQNVIRRIKTIYGETYGIQIESEIGEGTTIVVRILAVESI